MNIVKSISPLEKYYLIKDLNYNTQCNDVSQSKLLHRPSNMTRLSLYVFIVFLHSYIPGFYILHGIVFHMCSFYILYDLGTA